jgi:alanyl-tRNA synthetase
MNSLEIRQKFFDFFIKRGHEKVASSPLIPAQDPTLLFANAGMNQFKDVFLGLEKRSYKRAVSIQKCVRAGGKHNDLDNVGFTKRHLTFFEMMGNFSFGDYFKKEAIEYAWDFLTKEMKLPVEKLHATVYKTDDESYDLWHKTIGIPASRMHRLGEEDNFWQMGDTGPCGPCTEIHIDRGPKFGCPTIKECGPACNCDRFLEIWNLVFMQYDRQSDGQFKNLKQTGVDTGMGFERLCTVVQKVDSVFNTDLLMPIINKIQELTGKKYALQDAPTQAAFHVLADHIRSSSLIIADGGAPSNEGRGYVLRKIIRRAALFAQKLTDQNIFPELSRMVVDQLGDIYPELKVNSEVIYKILDSEIKKFSANLLRGQQILKEYFAAHAATKKVTGAQTFKLYDTFGFPLELIIIMATEHGFTVDIAGFEELMKKQQEQSGAKKEDELSTLPIEIESEFTGYQELQTDSTIAALIVDNQLVEQVPAGTQCWVVAYKSPFFIVGGGQVPDQGWIRVNGNQMPIQSVRFINKAIAAQVTAATDLQVGNAIISIVDPVWRTNAMKNHTATHLLQSALIELFGKQIKQSGSLVHPDYLRFDFTYHENLKPEDITRVENLVNEKIRQNIPVNIHNITLKEAIKHGALAFFGDKYNPEKVRMVEVPDFSIELCGGTHVRATGEIGTFKITEVSALSAGHRRIVAVTGPRAIELFQETFNTVKNLSQEFKVSPDLVLQAAQKQRDQLKKLHAEIKQLKKQWWQAQLPEWVQKVEIINEIPFLCITIPDSSPEELKEITNALIAKKPGLYVAITDQQDKEFFFAQLAGQLANRLNLKKLGQWLKDTHGIGGGGTATILQGGAPQFDGKLEVYINEWLKQAH